MGSRPNNESPLTCHKSSPSPQQGRLAWRQYRAEQRFADALRSSPDLAGVTSQGHGIGEPETSNVMASPRLPMSCTSFISASHTSRAQHTRAQPPPTFLLPVETRRATNKTGRAGR
eukprot:3217873-Amphidinium_carterae.1